MPIFMDRHDIQNMTAKAVADAHQQDLKIQDKYGVKMLTYWFDEQRGTTFCLVDAPSREDVKKLHEEAHGLVPHQIMEVDTKTVESFLGRIEDPQPHNGSGLEDDASLTESAFRAIMFTDMKDSTAMTSRLGDEDALKLLKIHDTIGRETIAAHKGREIKHTGDGFMVSFVSASNAVQCARAMQQSYSVHNEKNPDAAINIRIGICAGEPVEEDQNLFGSTVQLASRICDKALAEQILVATVIRDLCLGKKFNFVDQGESNLKGFDKALQLFEVQWR